MLLLNLPGLGCHEKVFELIDEVMNAITIQDCSAQLLNFYVADLLCLSQIEKGVFRKILTTFDIRDIVKEVMDIQRDKAESNKIDFRCEFHGFSDCNFSITTDKMRLK